MLLLKKNSKFKIKFVRQDKVFFLFAQPFFLKSLLEDKYLKVFGLWGSVNNHFLWRLRNIPVKILNLSSEFFKKFE